MIRYLFFDIDDTLLDFTKCAAFAMKKGMQDFGIEYEDGMLPVFVEENEKIWKALERGELKDLDELYAVRWKIIFGKLGIQADGPEFEKVFLEYLKLSHEMVDDAFEVIEALSRTHKLYAISNAPHEQQLIRLRDCGMMPFLQAVYTSESIGAVKPTPAFFEKVFAAAEIQDKDEVLLIGDSLTADIAGGVQAGLRTCWFNRKGVRVEHQADLEIRGLKELLTCVF